MEFSYKELEDPQGLSKGIFLALLNCLSIPPHLGMVVDGRYHSLTVKGYRSKTVSQLLRQVGSSEIPSVFIGINRPDAVTPDFASWKLQGEVSCLRPIAEHFGMAGERSTVHDLLAWLQDRESIGNVYAVNMEGIKGDYVLPDYTFADVNAHIQSLLNK